MLQLTEPNILKKFIQDPYPMLEFIRAQRMVKSANNEWLVARDEDVECILKDSRFGKQPFPGTEHRLPFYARECVQRSSMLDIDPPDHTRIRSRFVKALSANRAEDMRPSIRARVDSILDDLVPQGRMEVMSEFARPIPSTIISRMLGVPESDRPDSMSCPFFFAGRNALISSSQAKCRQHLKGSRPGDHFPRA